MTYAFPLPDPAPPGPLDPTIPAQRAVAERVLGWLAAGQYLGPDTMDVRTLRRTSVGLHLIDGTTVFMTPAYTCTTTGSSTSCAPIAEQIAVGDSRDPSQAALSTRRSLPPGC